MSKYEAAIERVAPANGHQYNRERQEQPGCLARTRRESHCDPGRNALHSDRKNEQNSGHFWLQSGASRVERLRDFGDATSWRKE